MICNSCHYNLNFLTNVIGWRRALNVYFFGILEDCGMGATLSCFQPQGSAVGYTEAWKTQTWKNVEPGA